MTQCQNLSVDVMAAEEHVENTEQNEKSLKRKRQPSVLDNFTKLTNPQEKVRIRGGLELLKHLTIKQDDEKADDELKYALGRIVRGLGSSGTSAKTGFFVALVGLLNLKNVSVECLFAHVAKELHKGAANSKSENADVCFGQILVAGALIRSNSYNNYETSEKRQIIELLLKAGKERNYLQLAAFRFLNELFGKIDSDEFKTVVFPLIKAELAVSWQEQTLDSLYLLFEVLQHFPDAVHGKFLKNNLGTEEVLCGQSLRHLCNTLMTIPRSSALNHPLFDLVIAKVTNSDLLEEFFEHLDLNLAKNRNKYFVATKLLTGVLISLRDTTKIPNILTKQYIQQTISMSKASVGKQKDKDFHNLTQKLFEALVNALKQDTKSKTKIKVLKKLLFYPGTFIFEKVTRTKLVQNITGSLNVDGVKKLAHIYREVVLAAEDKVINENVKEKWWNTDRIYASHLLVKLLNHPVMQSENEWKLEQLVFLAKLSLFNNDNIGSELADSLKETFYSALDLKLSKLDDLRFILSKLFQEVYDLVKSEELRVPLEEHGEVWEKTHALTAKLETNSKKKKAVFHTLFLHLGLQIFNNSSLASSSLSELFSCYERLKKKDEEIQWIEVIVDLFLNLLSHNSHLLRKVINCVFPHLCKYLNGNALHQVLAVLDPKSDANPLSNESEEEEDDDDGADEDDDEESSSEDEEEEETVNERLRMALHQALGGTEIDSDVDLDEMDEEEGEKLNEALSQAFKQFKPNSGRSKKQKKDEETLTHFRIRVLDLIEIYLGANPSMLATLEIMLPLLHLLEFCVKDAHQKPLQDRVKVCLKKLTALKKFSECDVTEEVLVELLRSLIDKGERNSLIVQEMGEKIADCCVFVVNCAQIVAPEGDQISKILKESAESFFLHRNCVIPYVLFKNILQLNWTGVLRLVPFLFGCVFAPNVRPFRRNQAIELLKVFVHNQRFISGHLDEVKSIEKEVCNFLKDTIDFLRLFCQNPGEVKLKEKFLGGLMELLHCLKVSIGRSFESWEVLGEVIRECRSLVTFSRDTKLAYNKLCRSLNVSNVVKMKEKTIKLSNVEEEKDVEEEVEEKETETKEKKRKLSKEKLKLKKESKQLRLQSLSEGFSNKRKNQWMEEENKKLKV